MKTVTTKRVSWMLPALALAFAGWSAHTALAQPEQDEEAPKAAKAKAPKAAKAPKTTYKTVSGTFSQADATSVKIKSPKEEMSADLVPTTVYWRVQPGVGAEDLKVGEVVKVGLRGTDGIASVESLAPLTLKFGEDATVTFQNSKRAKFDRITKIAATDIAAEQNGRVVASVFPDGHIEAREVWVDVEPEKKAAPKN